ncbi:hypothetical protein HLB23_14760 [Nocardia uniformis]|uniref:Uncharacterized protein n=1 Tax=Nocardia uniformis TaxID=53432 RepID=A0A849CDF0_9NOCA|nr:hypothetical protein [Nocardia uniformis]NNH71111.1 hypothetical protein [Nocardia uniformis]
MTIRRLPLIAATIGSATALSFISGTTATATPPLAPPVIEDIFAVTGTVSVKFHNPNDTGVCWIYNEENGEIFGGDNPTSFATPDGLMIQTSLGNGQLPAGTMRVRGACAFVPPSTGGSDHSSITDVYVVELPTNPNTPPTGSFG